MAKKISTKRIKAILSKMETVAARPAMERWVGDIAYTFCLDQKDTDEVLQFLHYGLRAIESLNKIEQAERAKKRG